MSKYIKLKDKGTIFHDAGQDATVTGDQVIEVKETAKVKSALKGGVIVEATKAEFEASNKTVKTAKTAEPAKTTEPAKGVDTDASGTGSDKPYAEWTKAELNDELEKRKIEHKATANNADLIALLEADDAEKKA